jgi:outer membrane immunogenic protein
MKHFSWVIASTALLGSLGTAMAADMPLKAMPAPAPVYYNWSGCYVGGNVGYTRADVRSDSLPNAAFVAGAAGGAVEAAAEQASSVMSAHPDGITAGGGVGCNYQTGMFVVGGEGDFNYSGLKLGQIRGPFPGAGGGVPYTFEEQFRSDWFATLRARGGVVVGERTLLYVTGGAAFAEFNTLKALDFPGFTGFRYQSTTSDDRFGWVIGVGGEYAFTNNWSAKIEYLHMDFGSTSSFAQRNIVSPGAGGLTNTYNFREDVVRVGLNYRFGSTAVVAKY